MSDVTDWLAAMARDASEPHSYDDESPEALSTYDLGAKIVAAEQRGDYDTADDYQRELDRRHRGLTY